MENIEENDFDVLTYSYNWEEFMNNLPLQHLHKKIQKMKIREERNLWFYIHRNADPNKHSKLYIVSYQNPGVASVFENAKVLVQHSFIEQEIINAISNTQMYVDAPIQVEIETQQQNFKNWSKENILTKEEVESWNPLWRKMTEIQDYSCEECARLFREKQQLHTRKYMKQQDEMGQEQQKQKLKAAIRKLKQHRASCENKFEIQWFGNSFDSLYQNDQSFDLDLLECGLSNLNTPFWSKIADYSKYSIDTMKKMQQDVKNKICRKCDEDMKTEDDMDDIDLQEFKNKPSWNVCNFFFIINKIYDNILITDFFLFQLYSGPDVLFPEPSAVDLSDGTILLIPWELREKNIL